MAKTQTDYVTFEDGIIVWLGCMNCNDTIATAETGVNEETGQTRKMLKTWSHMTRFPVKVTNVTSPVDILLCADCVKKDLDLEHLERTMHLGWMKETRELHGGGAARLSNTAKICQHRKITGRA